MGRFVIAIAVAFAALASFGAGAMAASMHHGQPRLDHGPTRPVKHHPAG